LGEGYNAADILFADPTAHAEIQAIRMAVKKMKNYRITWCKLYMLSWSHVLMCAGAMISCPN